MTQPGSQPALAHPLHARLLSYVQANLHEPTLGHAALQAAFGLSRATVYRVFHELGGLQHYIRSCRLDAARQHLLQFPDRTLTWLLYELGFQSERQFQRAFQAHFGMSPSDWKRQCLQGLPRTRRPLAHQPWLARAQAACAVRSGSVGEFS
ncbi:helix-turn-helix domain-containing protein [Xanthomonas euvesicatoria]|uniref:AraC-like DNA-binding protein n=1 Tax=Xanthomonas euvesicatoria TaxID=456327 RepID=A0AAW3U5A3_XANEU|nr:helix-turn-helix domain-containing protein [Xanthomonas euvesicatoria]MBB4724248.1 AraC-like DNA-binding protein [Xanthomonas euvesicatoria]MBB4870841.1 AraC-like DNA-binding protein [Xanthomonas euvesicatoria]